jgi:hypothetical protein
VPLWLYAALCVLVPAVWAVAMYFLFGWVDRRRAARNKNDLPPIDYSI